MNKQNVAKAARPKANGQAKIWFTHNIKIHSKQFSYTICGMHCSELLIVILFQELDRLILSEQT